VRLTPNADVVVVGKKVIEVKKALIAVAGLLLIAGVVVVTRLGTSRAVAEMENGLSPFTALPLHDGRNTGVLAPGEGRWYEIASSSDGVFQRQVNLTLFFTPDDGNRAHQVNFQIFSNNQITDWYWGDRGQMPNMGAGGVVSRDGNPVTGELLWSGWMMSNETFYIQVYNGTVVNIDYWLFTDDVIAAELGPANDPQTVDEPSPENSSEHEPATPLPTDAEPLLPLAAALSDAQMSVPAEIWDAPTGTPTRLLIPAIALDSPIIPVGQTPLVVGGDVYWQWNTADHSVGWHNQSARLGQSGNTVLNGHSDINASVFRQLERVRIGDEITVLSGDQIHRYTVAHKFLVKEKDVSIEERVQNAAWIASTQDERLTLVTCAKPGATHRLIMIAQP
jgi:LPXTG-site transpeptidase (sortase) family protein